MFRLLGSCGGSRWWQGTARLVRREGGRKGGREGKRGYVFMRRICLPFLVFYSPYSLSPSSPPSLPSSLLRNRRSSPPKRRQHRPRHVRGGRRPPRHQAPPPPHPPTLHPHASSCSSPFLPPYLLPKTITPLLPPLLVLLLAAAEAQGKRLCLDLVASLPQKGQSSSWPRACGAVVEGLQEGREGGALALRALAAVVALAEGNNQNKSVLQGLGAGKGLGVVAAKMGGREGGRERWWLRRWRRCGS